MGVFIFQNDQFKEAIDYFNSGQNNLTPKVYLGSARNISLKSFAPKQIGLGKYKKTLAMKFCKMARR